MGGRDHDPEMENSELLRKWAKEIARMEVQLGLALKSATGRHDFTLNPEDGTVWVFEVPDHALDAFLRHSKAAKTCIFMPLLAGPGR